MLTKVDHVRFGRLKTVPVLQGNETYYTLLNQSDNIIV